MLTLAAFLFTIAVLIVVHEWGHYRVARACGVKVLRFSLGFGPVLMRHTDRHGTEWVLSALPLGGYVKMVDEREGLVETADIPYAFNRQSLSKRSAIVAAGPVANLLLAVVLYWGLFVSGITTLRPIVGEAPAQTAAALAGITSGEEVLAVAGHPLRTWEDLHWRVLQQAVQGTPLELDTRDKRGNRHLRHLDPSHAQGKAIETDPLGSLGLTHYQPPIAPVIGALLPDGRAALAGLRENDRIVDIGGKPIADWQDMVAIVRAAPGQSLLFAIERAGKHQAIRIEPAATDDNGERVGRIGAAPKFSEVDTRDLLVEVRYGPFEALGKSIVKMADLSTLSLEMMGRMILGQVSTKNISGPITIADFAGQSAHHGIASFIAFLALISLSLGILNLLPVPVLDGGHLLYHLAEFLMGRPPSEQALLVGQKIGLGLLGLLMTVAIYNDLARVLGH